MPDIDKSDNNSIVTISAARKLAGCIILFIVLFILDQVTKKAAVQHLAGKSPYILIKGVLEFKYTENTGAAFGMLKGAKVLFSVIATAAIIAVFYAVFKSPGTRKYSIFRILIVFIAAGAAGNLADRLLLGYVRDFIYFSLINFPIFNVADIYVTTATFLLVIAVLFYYRDEHDFDFLSKKK